MKTAGRDIRSIAIKACRAGVPRRQIAAIAGYHLHSVSRWICEFEQEEKLEARLRGHRASIFSQDERRELIELIGEHVDLTLKEIRSHSGKDCSLNAIHRMHCF
ncbi:MAG: helix-turn-helix domain-containing protein [Desulfovibrio sp.]|jgi:transposase|nr:helix-turn-helix domain-containing protein [Desulfovibrio sp.]